jgi:hypothetical protein
VRTRRYNDGGISHGERTTDETTENVDQEAVVGVQLHDVATVIMIRGVR